MIVPDQGFLLWLRKRLKWANSLKIENLQLDGKSLTSMKKMWKKPPFCCWLSHLFEEFFVVNLNPVLSTSIYPQVGWENTTVIETTQTSLRFHSFLWFRKKRCNVSPSAMTGEPGYVKCSYGLWLRIDQNYKQVPKNTHHHTKKQKNLVFYFQESWSKRFIVQFYHTAFSWFTNLDDFLAKETARSAARRPAWPASLGRVFPTISDDAEKSFPYKILRYTPPKFNSSFSPEKLPETQKERIGTFQPSIFRGELVYSYSCVKKVCDFNHHLGSRGGVSWIWPPPNGPPNWDRSRADRDPPFLERHWWLPLDYQHGNFIDISWLDG